MSTGIDSIEFRDEVQSLRDWLAHTKLRLEVTADLACALEDLRHDLPERLRDVEYLLRRVRAVTGVAP